ncbi:MAG: glycine zipper 2TM domain-containing protein [Rhodoferax sp.]
MNASVNTLPAGAVNTKPLWAAVGVLGVAVVALGASLVYVQSRPADGHAALAAMASEQPPELVLSGTRAALPAGESLDAREDLVAPPARPAVTQARPAPATAATRPAARSAPAPVAGPAVAAPAPTPAPVVAAAGTPAANPAPSVVTESGVLVSQPVPQRVVCSTCGTVEAVTPIQRNVSQGSGVGAVAGGALGAVVGNQIGRGSGRMLATVIGAVGGGLAGNAIEKNIKKQTVYQVQVRMEDGSLRTLEQSSPATVGARVTVEGNQMRAEGSQAAAPAPTRPAARPMVVSTYPPNMDRP